MISSIIKKAETNSSKEMDKPLKLITKIIVSKFRKEILIVYKILQLLNFNLEDTNL